MTTNLQGSSHRPQGQWVSAYDNRKDFVYEEISCSGCKPENWCRYHVAKCCEDKGINNCSQCSDYPCQNMKECFEITKSFEPMCKQVCTNEEYLKMKKAFFEKEQNLRNAT